jgi:ATP-dependent helicase YprA (DUF1998 family)
MNVFEFRDRLVANYASYINSFIRIREPRIDAVVQENLGSGILWPEPLIQLNPSFASGAYIDDLVRDGVLHPECARIFRLKRQQDDRGEPLRLHRHQDEAIRVARRGHNYVLTTGTGSGKSLAYIVPIVDYVLRHGTGGGIKAIVLAWRRRRGVEMGPDSGDSRPLQGHDRSLPALH